MQGVAPFLQGTFSPQVTIKVESCLHWYPPIHKDIRKACMIISISRLRGISASHRPKLGIVQFRWTQRVRQSLGAGAKSKAWPVSFARASGKVNSCRPSKACWRQNLTSEQLPSAAYLPSLILQRVRLPQHRSRVGVGGRSCPSSQHLRLSEEF